MTYALIKQCQFYNLLFHHTRTRIIVVYTHCRLEYTFIYAGSDNGNLYYTIAG